MTRRTISMPDDLAAKIEKAARKDKRSFSAMVAELVQTGLRARTPRKFHSLGIDEGTGGVAENTDEALRELYAKHRW